MTPLTHSSHAGTVFAGHGAFARLELLPAPAYIDPRMSSGVRYSTRGTLHGPCSHKHKNIDGAFECLDAHEALCVTRGGHTDRTIYAIDSGKERPLNADELAALAVYRTARKHG